MTIYGIPLLTLLIGAVIGIAFLPQDPSAAQKDIYTVIGSVVGLSLGLFWLKGHSVGQTFNPNHQPVILRADNQVVMNLQCERGGQ